MKKIMLYISLIMVGIYAAAICFVILGQDFIKGMYFNDMSTTFIVPTGELFIYLIGALVTIAFNILLQRAIGDLRTNVENTAIIAFSLWIILCPWILGVICSYQNMIYARFDGVSALAGYSAVHNALMNCTSVLNFAMLLLIIFSAISLGSKNERKKDEITKENRL